MDGSLLPIDHDRSQLDAPVGWTVHVVVYLSGRNSEGPLVERLKTGYGLGSLMVIQDSRGSRLNPIPPGTDVTVLMASKSISERVEAEDLAARLDFGIGSDVIASRIEIHRG